MKIFIWGMGLIGASLAQALRAKGHEIRGAVRSAQSRDLLLAQGFTAITTDENEALAMLKDCDMLALGLNVGDCYRILDTVLADQALYNRLIVFDMCSTKAELLRYVEANYRTARFIGTHPMAGKEKQGPAAAEASLFENSVVFLTPPQEHNANDLKTVETLWQSTGARTCTIDAAQHDEVMAYVSHGLHLAACVIAELSDKVAAAHLPVSAAAGSYRDMTRVATSSGEMWQGITDSNRENIADWLVSYAERLKSLAGQVRAGNADIAGLFSEAQRIRNEIMRT